MKYFAVLAFAIGAFALPQDSATVTSAPTTTAVPGLTPAVSCALACDASDVNCKAACMGNARPNASQAIETNECAANCDQGDGSTADSIAYGKCVQSCISSLFPSSQTAFDVAAAAASSGASVVSGTTVTSTASAGARETGSTSGTAATPQYTGAAGINSARIAGAGFAGLLAVFAL